MTRHSKTVSVSSGSAQATGLGAASEVSEKTLARGSGAASVATLGAASDPAGLAAAVAALAWDLEEALALTRTAALAANVASLAVGVRGLAAGVPVLAAGNTTLVAGAAAVVRTDAVLSAILGTGVAFGNAVRNGTVPVWV